MSAILYGASASFVAAVFSIVTYAIIRRWWKCATFKKKENKDYTGQGTQWSWKQHEYYVERFYETGLTGKHDFHGGYLNFGFWEDGNTDYIQASQALLTQVADPVSLCEDSRLLDVANGMGSQDIFYYNRYKPKHIDMIEATLTHHLICKKRVEEYGLQDNLTAHYGSATNLPFSDNTFTHVFSIEGGVHYKTRQKFVEEAYRVLKPNGWLSLADFAMPKLPGNFIENALGRLCSKLWNAPLENWCSPAVFKQRMEDAGFVDVEVKDVGSFCIPGYYYESMRPETLAALSKVRGWFVAHVACRVLDELILYVFKKKLLTYVIVHGRKPESVVV